MLCIDDCKLKKKNKYTFWYVFELMFGRVLGCIIYLQL